MRDKDVQAEIRRVQAAMAAKLLNLRDPGKFTGVVDAPGGMQVRVFRKVWRDNNRYRPPYNYHRPKSVRAHA